MTAVRRIVVHAIGSRGADTYPDVTSRFPGAAIVLAPFEEKTIARPRHALRIVREAGGEVILFGTPDLSLQRFQTVLKLILLLSPATEVGLVDLTGRSIGVSWISFFLRDLPFLIVEIVASMFVLFKTGIQLLFLRNEFRGRGE